MNSKMIYGRPSSINEKLEKASEEGFRPVAITTALIKSITYVFVVLEKP